MKALIIDDEKQAIVNLQSIIETWYPGQFSEIFAAQTIEQALEKQQQFQPDVIFLDVQLKNVSGFDFLNRVTQSNFKLVFVTAYDQYAIRAIRLNAFDYLLKPVDIHELGICLRKLAEATAGEPRKKEAFNAAPDYILLHDAVRYEKIFFASIYYLEASGPYTNVVYNKNGSTATVVRSKPLSDFEELLQHEGFIRIHRSYVVNLKRVTELVKNKDKFFVQVTAKLLPVSRRRFSMISELLQG